MPAFGVVSLGASSVNPALSAFVPNGEAGRPAEGWITVENRGAFPIAVTPAWNDSSPDSNYGFTVPPVSRSTVPVDPERGVLLTALPAWQVLRTVMVFRHFARRNVLYALHRDGVAGTEPLYPPHALMAVSAADLILTGAAQSVTLYVGPTGLASGVQLAPAPEDICIMAVTLTLESNGITSGSGEVVGITPLYDTTLPTENGAGTGIAFAAGDAIGSVYTMNVRGAFGVIISAGVIAAETVTVSPLLWLGVPAT